MKTFKELAEQEIMPETDDWQIAALMMDEIVQYRKEFRVLHIAKWIARLREHYVAIGEAVAKLD